MLFTRFRFGPKDDLGKQIPTYLMRRISPFAIRVMGNSTRFGKWLIYNVEKDLRFVQDQAGHASPTTTAIYAKTNNTARKRQVEALDEEEL